MRQSILATIGLLLTILTFGQKTPNVISQTNFCIGKTIEIESKTLGEARKLNIYLPASYDEDSSKHYPVIYLLDGSADEDFIHISGLVQFGSFSWINMLPESIVVGITNVDRQRDFTYPSQNELDLKDLPTSGKSANFMRFIENELQPFIESTFRTTETKSIIGQSLGGLLATEVLFVKPELFDNYIIVSPSLWWDDESLLVREPKTCAEGKSIYIAGGTEGEVMERTAKELFEKLNNNKQYEHVYYEFLDDKNHGDALHIAVYHAFEKLFNSDNKSK